MHRATQFAGDRDRHPTQNLLTAVRGAGIDYIVYISLVGVDQIPLGYYATKLRVEQSLAASGISNTIRRATQLHDLIARNFAVQRFSPVPAALRGVRFQRRESGPGQSRRHHV